MQRLRACRSGADQNFSRNPIIWAYREHLDYSVEDLAVTSGLIVEEVELIEIGRRHVHQQADDYARSKSLDGDGFVTEVLSPTHAGRPSCFRSVSSYLP